MSDVFLDIHIALPPDEYIREVLPGVIADIGFDGFVEDDRGIHGYIKKELWTSTMDSAIKRLSEELHLPLFEIISIKEIENKNWNDEWEKSIQPITVSDSIIISPSWHHVEGDGKMVITIDPKMTFGTGYHETTRLVLRSMEHMITRTTRMLDVGTGTGILAIAGAKLGAAKAIGIDIDEWSLDNGIENVIRNNVSDSVEIRMGSLESVPETDFDLIVANIVRNTILELLDDMLAKLAVGGTIVLSGLLKKDRSVIEEAFSARHFSIVSVQQENEWIAITARGQVNENRID